MSSSSRKTKISSSKTIKSKEPQEITIEIDTPSQKPIQSTSSKKIPQEKLQSLAPAQISSQLQSQEVQKITNIGSKIVKSKDIIDTSIPLFTTQRKRVLNFAIKNKIPSKFVFPIYASQREHTRSDISEDLETIEDYIKRESKKFGVTELVDNIKEIDPRIRPEEILFYISNFINRDDNNDFFERAARITPAYEDPETFMNDKYNWEREELLRLLERDIQDIEQLEVYFENIQAIDPVQTSDMTIEKMTLEFDVVVKDGNDSLIHTAPDLFANMKTSYDVPFVKYNDRYFSKYKVFSGDTFETRPPFKLFQQHFTKFEERNMIYMILLVDPGSNMQEYTKTSYISVSLNLTKNILNFKYFLLANRPENEIIQSIQNVMPNIKLLNRHEKNYGASFNIYNTYIRDDSFLDILISEPFIALNSPRIFSAVLFADEYEKPVSEKKKLKVYYDTNIGFEADTVIEIEGREKNEELSKLAALGFYMTQYKSGINDTGVSKGRYTITDFKEGDDKIIGTKNTIVKSLFLPLDTPYIVVSISKAVNRFVLFQFMNVFARLLSIYNQVRDVYEDEYNNLIPELKDSKIQEQELTLILKPAKTVGKEKMGKINLRTIAPEIFTESYSRDCQYKNQPIIITDSEIDSWKNRKIIKGNQSIERPIKQLGDYNFVCPTNAYPYVEFKQNLDDDRTFDKYPCCYKSQQGGVRQRERGTSQRSNVPIKTNKIMGEGGIANLPTSIEEMLQGAFSKPLTFYRTGSLINPSSFLACIVLALEDPLYINLKSVEEKENYINQLRLNIAAKENFLTTSSELFDVAEKDRIENFKKLEDFLDPAIYYRVVEELFNVNIFIFSGSLPKPNVEPIYTLEISRFSSIPIHSFKRNVPTILIYKHWGAETDHLEYPQCELIIAHMGDEKVSEKESKKIEEGSTASLFSDDIAKYLLKGYFISAGVYGRLYIPEINIFENYSSKLIYKLLLSDFLDSFMNPSSGLPYATGQIIDEKGKLCGLQIKTPYGDMTIGVPALPPQNLPLNTKIERPKLSDVFKVFTGEPTGYSYEGDNVVAVWFRLMDLEFGIQIPVNPENKEQVRKEYRKLLPNVPENRFVLDTKLSEIQRLLKLKKDVNIIIQLVRWLFLIAIDGEGFNSSQRLEAVQIFLDNMMKEVPRREQDSALIYDFSKLPRKLPEDRSSIETILEEIQKTTPTFTDGKKILISGKTFYSRVRESLEHYVRLNLPIIIPNYLDGYYESVYDYPKFTKTLVFLSTIDFKRWLEQAIEDPTSTYPVLYSLKGKLSEMNHPYLYSVESETPSVSNPFGQSFLFLIQNAPFVNSKASALENSIRWRDVHVNHPKISDVLLSKFKNYKVFTISQSESFEVIEDMSDEDDLENTIFILQYPGTDKYASVLPI
jgi:hypothetical protein